MAESSSGGTGAGLWTILFAWSGLTIWMRSRLRRSCIMAAIRRTIAWQSQHATPDYPGMTKKVVEEQLGGACLFLQAATGNIGPRRGFTGDMGVYRKFGRLLGLEASKLALGIETLPKREKLIGLQESGARIALFEDEAVEPEPATLD